MDATKIFSHILLLIFIFCLQNCTPKFVQVNNENNITALTADVFNDSVFKILNTKYDTVIGFSHYNENKNLPIQSYFLCFKKDYSIGFQNIYKLNPINHEENPITKIRNFDDSLQVNKKKFIEILNGWDLSYNDNANYTLCKKDSAPSCFVQDGPFFNVYIKTLERTYVSTLYAPDYFEKLCCPGNNYRSSFLKLRDYILLSKKD